MKPLFPRWSNTVVNMGLLVAGAAIVGAPTLLMVWVRQPYVTGEENPMDQPIAFDHRHHVRDDGIECRYCHYEAWRSPNAGVPPTSVCMNCHSQVWVDSDRLRPVRASFFTGEPIRWNRVHQLPGFVYFDHSAHVTHGVECTICHGHVELMSQVYAVEPLTMRWCLDCHRDPASHIGADVAARFHVQPPTSCTGCHR
jgi:hypothetical protein